MDSNDFGATDEAELDRRIQEILHPQIPRRKRGRPRTGSDKAWNYYLQWLNFTLDGMRSWAATEKVAQLNRMTALHIAACRKRVEDEMKANRESGAYSDEYGPLEETSSGEDDSAI
jgi:hypothetical protein